MCVCVCVFVVCGQRKRPRKELDQQHENKDKDLTAAEAPTRRTIKLTSVRELRDEVTENTHTGEHNTYQKLHTSTS